MYLCSKLQEESHKMAKYGEVFYSEIKPPVFVNIEEYFQILSPNAMFANCDRAIGNISGKIKYILAFQKAIISDLFMSID